MSQREWIDKDYYGDLGVASTATAEEIKKAYRTIARDNHPDKNPDNPAAESRFKAASEAYSVVGDKDKRAEYDELKRMVASGGFGMGGFGGPGAGGAGAGGAGAGGFGGFRGGGFDTSGFGSGFGESIFSDLFNAAGGAAAGGGAGGFQRGGRGRPKRGADVETDITLDFREATKGVTVPIRLTRPSPCGGCHGSGSADGSAAATCGECSGRGVTNQSQGMFNMAAPCSACQGEGTIIKNKCLDCSGTGRTTTTTTISVRVPPGVVDGQKVRLAGQGAAGTRGLPAGDLFVTVHVRPDTVFSRKGDDLLLTVPVSYSELVLGGAVTVPTLDTKVRVRIPQGTADGTTLRVRGRGVSKRNGASGDLLVTVKVAIPTDLDDAAMSALRTYTEEEQRSGFDPRANWEGARA